MNKPTRPCLRCKKRTTNNGGYCDVCMERRQKTIKARVSRYDNMRGSSAKRGYDADWRKVRTAKLAMTPLCECDRCKKMGRILVADTVHHIKPVESCPDLRLNVDNLMSMAEHCHEVEHGRSKDFEFIAWERRGGMMGFDFSQTKTAPQAFFFLCQNNK